ncbi:MAG: class I SAM-dependent methyltransferase [Planctomycetota bacterium]
MDEVGRQQFLLLEKTHWWFEGRRRIFFHVLRQALQGRRGLKILDVGCGVGGMLGPLREFGEPLGIELDFGMVQTCRTRGFGRTLVASALSLPVRERAFDLVTFFDCLEHLDDDLGALCRARDAMRPGALLFISGPAYQFLYANNDRVAHHKRRYTLGRLRERVRAAGFEVLHDSYINTLLFPAILPAVLLIKLKERWVPRDGDATTNLTWPMPPLVHRLLAGIFGFERHLVPRVTLPAGHSLVLLARRPPGNDTGNPGFRDSTRDHP